MKKTVHKPIPYKDCILRAFYCLLAAHFVVKMSQPGFRTFEVFTLPSYYLKLAIHYGIFFIAAIAVKKITVILDRRHEWHRDIWRRGMLQFAFGVAGVSILSFFLVWAYFWLCGQDIVASGYLDHEVPFTIALITIINLYYAASYLYLLPRRMP